MHVASSVCWASWHCTLFIDDDGHPIDEAAAELIIQAFIMFTAFHDKAFLLYIVPIYPNNKIYTVYID